MKKKWFARLEFKAEDFWVGAYWKKDLDELDVWVCLFPMFPVHFGWRRAEVEAEKEMDGMTHEH